MPVLTLPDGSTRSFDGPVTGAHLAADIGAGLAKAALAITVAMAPKGGAGGGLTSAAEP